MSLDEVLSVLAMMADKLQWVEKHYRTAEDCAGHKPWWWLASTMTYKWTEYHTLSTREPWVALARGQPVRPKSAPVRYHLRIDSDEFMDIDDDRLEQLYSQVVRAKESQQRSFEENLVCSKNERLAAAARALAKHGEGVG